GARRRIEPGCVRSSRVFPWAAVEPHSTAYRGATAANLPIDPIHANSQVAPAPPARARRTMHADTTARKGVPDKPSFEPSGHQVQFYKDDAFIVATVAGFVTDALHHGRGAIVISSKAHLDAVLEKVGDVRNA